MIFTILKTASSTILILLVMLIIISGGYLLTPGKLEVAATVIIMPKSSIRQISYQLSQLKIIRYPGLFKLLAQLHSLNSPLKSGEYIFARNICALQILRILSQGQSIIHKLVIPEGLTVSEILAKINAEDRLLGKITIEVPEGWLLPATYFFCYGNQKQQLVKQMHRAMTEVLDEVMMQLSTNSPLSTRLEVLTLASIVEKETSLDEERPMIAAVFINRLKKGMRLQADPTAAYAITAGKFPLRRLMSKKDLLIQSPYNTYRVSNLPPGPIACPSLKSLLAAVRPAQTKALYFAVSSQGRHKFASSFKEHCNNVQHYKRSQISKP